MERFKMRGTWSVISENVHTGEVTEKTFDNLVVQGFYDLIHRFMSFDQLAGVNADDMNVTHLGIGDGTTAPTRNDTILENEVERVTVTVKTISDTVYTLKFFLDAGVGNLPGGYIKELGIFTKGTATLDSGTMISRALSDIQKNNNIRLTLIWTLRGN